LHLVKEASSRHSRAVAKRSPVGIPIQPFGAASARRMSNAQPLAAIVPAAPAVKAAQVEPKFLSAEEEVDVDAILKSLGFPQCTVMPDKITPVASVLGKRTRRTSSDDEVSMEELKRSLKRKDSSFRSQETTSSSTSGQELVVRNQLSEIRQLLKLNDGFVTGHDDSSVLNLVIKMLREDTLTKRSISIAQTSAPTFMTGIEFLGSDLDAAREGTLSLVGVSKGRFQNSADYQCVFENSPFAQAICTLDGCFVDCNKMFEEITGYTKELICQTTLFATMDAKDVPQFLACVEPLISGQMKIYMKQRKCIYANGEAYMVQCFISLIRDAQNNVPLYFNCMGFPMYEQPR